jgi:hypothetical protein
VALTTQPHAAPGLKKARAIPLPHFCPFVACSRVNFTYTVTTTKGEKDEIDRILS